MEKVQFLSIFHLMSDQYMTIRDRVRTETAIRGSRFLATAIPVHTKEEAHHAIEAIRKEFVDATHTCYAYRLGLEGEEFRSSDDGEPGGSAGKPILAAIVKAGVTDALVVVTRFFGGTKLGIGGLMRAYGGAAARSLAATQKVSRFVVEELRVAFPHSQVGAVMHVVSKAGARIVETTYDEEVHLALHIRRSAVEEVRTALLDRTAGNIRIMSDDHSSGRDRQANRAEG